MAVNSIYVTPTKAPRCCLWIFSVIAFSILFTLSIAYPSTAAPTKSKKITYPSLFGTKEKRSRNFKPFKKWNGALKRYAKEQKGLKPGKCKSTKFNQCHYDKWQKFLATLKDKDQMTKVKKVNRYMNRARYILDPVNWGKKDYWASPGQFIAKFGDCEDYAIAKYMSLKQLGFKTSEMRVVAVKDMNLKIGHAVLVVYLNGKALILDNQIKKVVSAKVIKHYIPVFSINEKYWWRHK
ncbi:MAG: transglutaminase-like cysteine peptidase [Alphaproteobacteria bacterium]|nr:transglutaminase-like cysteine peptidase [Alphaproteobacteria bacterium]